MKKLLLTLTLLLTLGFAASAENLTLGFKTGSNTGGTTAGKNTAVADVLDEASVSLVASLDTKTNVFPATANGVRVGATAGGKFVFTLSQAVKATKVIFIGKTYGGSNKTKLTKSQITFNNQAGEEHNYDSGASVDYEDTFVLDGSELEQLTIQVTTGIFISKIEIYEDEQPEPEAIELSEDNILIEDHNGQSLFGAASYEYEAGAKISFNYSYTGEVVNPEINYSYSVNDGEAVEGNEYTYDGNSDVVLKMMVISGENTVSKTITILKKYPTVCPAPDFSVENNAGVSAGQVIKVSCDGAKTLAWSVNGTPIEGDTYTVTETVGTQLNFEAEATIDGRLASGELGELSSTANLVVYVVEATEATFTFAGDDANSYGMTPIESTEGTLYEKDKTKVTKIVEGIVSIDFVADSRYRYWKSDQTLRVNNGVSFTISVPEEYYIISVALTGKQVPATVDTGSYENKEWTPAESSMTSKVVFTADGSTMQIQTITVKYAKRPTPVVKGIRHEVDEDAARQHTVMVNYMLHVDFHNGDDAGSDYKVFLTIDGKEYDGVHSLYIAAADAPMRALGVNDIESTHTFVGRVGATDLPEANTDYTASIRVEHNGNVVASTEPFTVSTNNTTGIEDVTVEGNEAAEYFNLQGVRVAQPQAGQIYIVRRGAKATKELVK